MDNWLLYKLNDGMYELIFGPISGPVLDKLMPKSEIERKCTDLQNGTHRKWKNYYSKLATLCYVGSNW